MCLDSASKCRRDAKEITAFEDLVIRENWAGSKEKSVLFSVVLELKSPLETLDWNIWLGLLEEVSWEPQIAESPFHEFDVFLLEKMNNFLLYLDSQVLERIAFLAFYLEKPCSRVIHNAEDLIQMVSFRCFQEDFLLKNSFENVEHNSSIVDFE